MTIYLDIVWLLNFGIDYLLLALTALALKRNYTQRRLILAAIFASLIVFFMFTSLSTLFFKAWVKLIYSACIVLIAFGFKRWSYFLKNLFMFYFVTFVVGGGLFALHYFWKTDAEIVEGLVISTSTGFGSTFSWIFVLIGIPAVWYFSKQQIQQITIRKLDYSKLADVTIQLENLTIKTKGLIDSGNQLHDPFSRAPVIIIEVFLLREGLSEKSIQQILNWDQIESGERDELLQKRFTFIPYQAVGKTMGLLPALKPDYVKVEYEQEQFTTRKVVVAIQERPLSTTGDYHCIVHPNLLLSKSSGKELA